MYKRAAALVILALAAAPTATAEPGRKLGEVDTATIATVDREAPSITVDSKQGARTYAVEPVTRILRGAEPIGIGELTPGDRVLVEATDEIGDGTSRMVAERIVVVVEEPAPAAE